MGLCRRILLVALLLVGSGPLLLAQKNDKDSLFRLVQAERAEQYERFGTHYRLVKGKARFLHNDTYLLCDSASWNVDYRLIEAFGNVQVIQNNTMLKSEQMIYWIDDSRAQFRGPLVELFDKDGNTLRTTQLNYNTKDSVAVFEGGGALKDKDGGVIEGRKGMYDAKEGLFTFEDRVEIYMDSIEIRTRTMRYLSEEQRAYFGRETYVWRDNGFLRADAGWYDRAGQEVCFSDQVYMFDPAYDAWADEAHYLQDKGVVDLYRNAQVLDTANKAAYLGDHLQYLPKSDSLPQQGWLSGHPAIVYFGENENHVVDTLFVRADTFYVFVVPKHDVPPVDIENGAKRRADILFDALGKKREEDAAAREEERIKKLRQVGKLPPEWVELKQKREADSLATLARLDSLVQTGAIDSTLAAADSIRTSLRRVDSLIKIGLLPPNVPRDELDPDLSLYETEPEEPPVDSTEIDQPLDTTPVRYVLAWNNVKMYRSDLQAACDSLFFTEVDSVVRLLGQPVLWNEVRNQLSADEIQLLMKDGAFQRGAMITNAWIISQRDTSHYDQIKSPEMQGWFRDNKLYRFDALGGVSAIFYMADEDVLTTINVKESKSLTVAMKDATASRLFYVESIKSDVYPIGELVPEKQKLKDFKWRGDERPVSRSEITDRAVRSTERARYSRILRPKYPETNKYFDNYMNDLFEQRRAEKAAAKAARDSIAAADAAAAAAAAAAELVSAGVARDTAEARVSMAVDTLSPLVVPFDELDSLAVAVDTLSPLVVPFDEPDSLAVAVDTLTPLVVPYDPIDSAAFAPGAALAHIDSLTPLVVPFERIDTTVVAPNTPASPETVVVSKELTRAEKRALRKAERQARREARRAAREARRAARRAAREARSHSPQNS